jgi:hypothetical protein
MIIRSIEHKDIPEIAEIHKAHFKDEFELHDFLRNHLCAFLVEDDDGIISVTGIRLIAEIVVITNKDRTPKDRMKAFLQLFNASIFMTHKHGFDQLHCFIQDPKWSKRVQKTFGFMPTKGQSLVLDI